MNPPSDPLAPFRSGKYPDRTRRAYDLINQHYTDYGAQCVGWWVAIRLSDGGSDGKLYGSKQIATHYQLWEEQCAYICLPPQHEFPGGLMPIAEIHRYLQVNEKVYDDARRAGYRARLADAGTHIVPRSM